MIQDIQNNVSLSKKAKENVNSLEFWYIHIVILGKSIWFIESDFNDLTIYEHIEMYIFSLFFCSVLSLISTWLLLNFSLILLSVHSVIDS
jgi:hypothetical protein